MTDGAYEETPLVGPNRRKVWRTMERLRRLRWTGWARLVAGLVLLDQAIGPITHLPSAEGIVIVCIGVLFAPVPAERDK